MHETLPPKIRIDHLIQIYGANPRNVLGLLQKGHSRASILEETGHVVGIADVSLTINQGELFVVMGLSGSGKSTLVRCINRLIQPTSGHIYIDNADVVSMPEQRMRKIRATQISMVFQRFGLFPHKTVVENVAYGLKIQGMGKKQRQQQALEILDVVGLADRAMALPATLSGGMQQRVGLARAVATGADILLMDEPFSALDPLIRRDMQDELLRLQRDLQKTIVFISHDIQEALKLGDRIAVMKAGQIVQIGSPSELVTHPANDYIRAFTQDVNLAQVLTAEAIAQPVLSIILENASVSMALQHMVKHRLRHLYVVDHQAQPIGLLEKQPLEFAQAEKNEDLMTVMQTNFSQVQTSTLLEQTFSLFHQGRPIAVVKPNGQLLGQLEAADILTCISR